jgi:hypothetical protein
MTELETITTLLSKLQKQQDSEAGIKAKAFERLLSEISVALSDVVDVMERGAKREAKEEKPGYDFSRLEDAMRSLKITAPAVTFSPNITVDPPKIEVSPQINIPPQPPVQIHIAKDDGTVVFEIDITSNGAGIPTSMHITRTKVQP